MPQKKDNGLKLAEVPTSEGCILVPYELRRSRRARYIRLSIGRHNQALLSVPWRCPFAEAMQFLRSQGDWIEERLKDHPTRTSLFQFLQKHSRLHGLGQSFRLTLGFTRAKPFYVYSVPNSEIEMRIPSQGDREAATLSLVREFASEVISLRVDELAKQCGVEVGRTTVRDQSSRWGSCSSNRTISLNWRLVLLRPNLQDHVILHELAHLTEMNHSPAFWELLQSYDPRTQHHNSQLNPAAARLMPLGKGC